MGPRGLEKDGGSLDTPGGVQRSTMTQHFPHASARAQRHRHHITTGRIGEGILREARTRSDDSKALLTVLLLALTLTEVQQTMAFTP
jgi:hypothetical protein